ncbi:MAG: glycosyltransferase [Armatimonadia bacterium]|nr:glycosyltransferase [Armatimonadia bacterium]
MACLQSAPGLVVEVFTLHGVLCIISALTLGFPQPVGPEPIPLRTFDAPLTEDQRVPRGNGPTSLAIIIPAYNEEEALPEAIEQARSYLEGRQIAGEVIVVDDGSTDRTLAVAEAAAEGDELVRVVSYGENRGKGHAVRQGVRHAATDTDAVVFLDADLATPVKEVDGALKALAEGADVVIGTRIHPEARIEQAQPLLRRVMGAGFRRLTRAMLGLRVSDITCGFKVFERDAAGRIFDLATIDGWAFDAELLVIADRLGLRIAELPVRWCDSRDSRVRPLRNAAESWQQLRLIRRRMREGDYDPRDPEGTA